MTRRKKPPFIQTIRRTIARHNLCPKGSKILVAHSAGADSTALLNLLHLLAPGLGIDLAVAHLNHGIRGDVARRDQEASEAMAKELGLPFFTETANTPALAQTKGIGMEEAARELRHGFLQKTANAWGADHIATGHHMDDVAEQILMNIMRGSGLTGLSAMGPTAENGIIRPLLEVGRDEIHAWLTAQGITFCTDETNKDTLYTRNRIRHTLLPAMKEGFNPEVSRALSRSAALLRDDEAWLSQLTEELFKKIVIKQTQNAVLMDAEALDAQHPAARKRIIRHAAQRLAGSTYGLTSAHFDSCLALLEKRKPGTSADLARGLRATITQGLFGLEKHERSLRRVSTSEKSSFHHELPPLSEQEPFTFEIPETGETFLFRRVVMEEMPQSPKRLNEIYIDPSKITSPLVLRSPLAGDRFRPHGGTGSRKISRFLNDCGIKGPAKESWPLLVDHSGIIWVAGQRRDAGWSTPLPGEPTLHVTFKPKKCDAFEKKEKKP